MYKAIKYVGWGAQGGELQAWAGCMGLQNIFKGFGEGSPGI